MEYMPLHLPSDAVAPYSAGFLAAINGGRGRLAAILVVAVVAIVGVSAHRHATLEHELTDAALARRASLSALAATILSEKFERLIDIGVSLATRVRFQELVASERWVEAVQILRRVPEDFGFFDRVFIADASGTLMADAPELPGARETNFSEREWYRGVSRAWTPYVSQLYQRTAAPRRNVIAVSVPIRGPGGGVAGILVLQVKIEKFFDWARQIDVGTEDRVLVVDGSGRAAFDSTASAIEVSQLPDPLPAREARVAGATGSAGAEIVRVAGGGEPLVRGFAPAAHGWGVVILQPARAAFATRDSLLRQQLIDGVLVAVFAVVSILFGTRILTHRRREEADRVHREALERARDALAKQAKRLRIVHEIDRAIIAVTNPEAIAAAVIQPLRELLGVARAIVNIFDLEAGQVEWLAAAGRHRTHVGPGVRYSMRMMGDTEALKRGEPQVVDTRALPPGPDVDALLASGVQVYMVVPMIAGGELIGAISFGGEQSSFAAEQTAIAQEVATQLAIAIAHARLFDQVRRHAEELEQRVRERTAQLEAANKELEAFSYSVSHDLRAPLRAVDGFSRIVQEDYAGKLDDEGRRLLGVIRDNSRKMGQLIDDLLEYSRLGRRPLASAEIDMKRLVEEVLADQHLPDGRPPKVLLESLPPARGDATLLKQAWVNLLSNAIKFSSKRPQPVIEVSGNEAGAENVYCVKDNGAGFDMKYYDKLFGVFQRLHREEEFDGTGVGLAIVQRVVVRHGGRVWAEGRVDEGAAFFFALPKGGRDGKI
jgi:signal transduction histidine kinase